MSHPSSYPSKRRHSSSSSRPYRGGGQWKTPATPSIRTGTGVRYGDLDLSPRNAYIIKGKSSLVSPLKNMPHRGSSVKQKHAFDPSKLRVIVMGGNEEIGRNMTLLEYGDDIILIDMGIQFANEDMRGVDGIIPDLSYLKGREHQVRAVIITHMHMDHIGAIPYLMPFLKHVPVFSAPITLALIAKKLEYTPEVKVDLRPVDDKTVLHLGNFTVSFFGVSHSVPSALAVVIDSPCGKLVHTGDFKVDFHPEDEQEKRMLDHLTSLGKQHVLALLSDSTNAIQPGNQLMEREVVQDLESIVASASGRLFFGMISTNVVRLAQIITLAKKHGRFVVVHGRSLTTTLEIAENLGYINVPSNTFLTIEEIKSVAPEKILAIFPGAQGESNGAFFKLAHDEIKELRLMPGDTVVFSSSVIPGNERSVQYITDQFYRRGVKVVNYRMLNIHAGGHAKAADLAEVVRLVNPRYLIPIEGHHAFLHHHAKAAQATGFPQDRIFIADNGQVMEFDKQGKGILTKKKLPLLPVFVDGKSVGIVDTDTLHERKCLGDEGMVSVHLLVKKGRLENIRLHSMGLRSKISTPVLYEKIETFLKREYVRLSQKTSSSVLEERLQSSLAYAIEKESGQKPCLFLQITRT